jgi:hypothetical protein
MSERFVSRWSRLKREAGAIESATLSPATAQATPTGDDRALPLEPAPASAAEPTASEAIALPPIESLTAESDFAAFMQPKVPEALKRQALKKMFSDPHFNVMDGLDIYIDDYSVGTPIPQDWYKDMVAWQNILNPKEAIITDGGYAVEPDSEEGRAILAAREQARLQAEAANDETLAALPSHEVDDPASIALAQAERVDTPHESEVSRPTSPETETK